MHGILPLGRERCGTRQQPLLGIDIERRQCGRARGRVRRVRVAVKQLDRVLRTLHEGVVDLPLCEHGAHRDGSVGQALGRGHEIGRHGECQGGERFADAAEARDDFVEYQQDVMLVADLAQPLEVAHGRQYHARRAGNRLDDDGRNGRRVMQRNQTLEFVRKVRSPMRQAARKRVVSKIQGVLQVIDAGQHRTGERLAVVDHAAHRHAAEPNAVIALLAADEARALAGAASAMIGNRDFQRRVDGFGSGVREEHAVHARRCEIGEPTRQFECHGMAHLKRGGVFHGVELLRHRLRDFRPAVPGVHAP